MNPCYTRRHFLARAGFGLGAVALPWLWQQDAKATSKPILDPKSFDLLPKQPQYAPRAKAMISMFMQGGPSQIDLFDPKPELDKLDGQKFPGEVKYDNAAEASPKVMACPWKFKKYGQSGMDVSELLPHFAQIVDDVTLIRSMHTGVNNHGQSIFALQNGRIIGGRPVLGSWLGYALGSESQNLPAFVALTDPRGLPVEGVQNWTNGFLPSIYQGTAVRAREPRILNLDAPAHLKGVAQENYLELLGSLNQDHLRQHPGETDLEARIASYELAARMQLAAKEALDISGESEATKRMYGVDHPATKDFGTRCLIARRLVERGVRFVQLYTGNQTWDHHGGIIKSLPAACLYVDQPAAALVQDLKMRGLLDSTVVHWGGEMGRLPVIQNDTGRDKIGRDHNTYGFSMWVAGGGFKNGLVYGETDQFGHKAVKDIVNHFDYHATLLHLFGIDASKLVYRRNGLEESLLAGQPGQVVKGLLA
jgi:hypothetical protein